MLSKRTKGLFVDKTDFYVLAARTSSARAPLVVEELREYQGQPSETEYRLMGQTKSNALVRARVAVAPVSRFLRRATLDSKRMKDAGAYLAEVLEQQFRLEPAKHRYSVIGAADGLPIDPSEPGGKEFVFVGAAAEELASQQQQLLTTSVYPERLELSSLALIGGLLSYLRLRQIKGAILVLELLPDQTNVNIVTAAGLDVTRSIPTGFNSFLPVVKQELGLRDEESARKVFFSNSFDFTTMGAQLIRKLVRDLQSAVGFYEVQSGQSISQVFMPLLPVNLRWLSRSFAEGLGVSALEIDFPDWLSKVGITIPDASMAAKLDARWLPLFAMMIDLDGKLSAAPAPAPATAATTPAVAEAAAAQPPPPSSTDAKASQG